MDTNRDGMISANELQKALVELGYHATPEQAARMVELADENGRRVIEGSGEENPNSLPWSSFADDGMIDFNEFISMAERTAIWTQPHAEDDILAAFKVRS